MRTIFIFTPFNSGIVYFVLEGDYRYLDNVGIGLLNEDESLQDKLNDLVYDSEGNPRVKFLQKFPVNEFFKGSPYDIVVVECGMY